MLCLTIYYRMKEGERAKNGMKGDGVQNGGGKEFWIAQNKKVDSRKQERQIKHGEGIRIIASCSPMC